MVRQQLCKGHRPVVIENDLRLLNVVWINVVHGLATMATRGYDEERSGVVTPDRHNQRNAVFIVSSLWSLCSRDIMSRFQTYRHDPPQQLWWAAHDPHHVHQPQLA